MSKAKMAYVLYSGGLDSTSLLNMVKGMDYEEVVAVIIDYGQKHRKEIECARAYCRYKGIPWMDVGIPYRVMGADEHFKNIEHKAYKDIEGTPSTWIPNRNNLFVNILTCIALRKKEHADIYIGTHKGDNMYPDTTLEWLNSLRMNLTIATGSLVHLYAPYWDCTKEELLRRGGLTREEVDMTYSCYEGGDEHCHECATCRERDDAIKNVFGE